MPHQTCVRTRSGMVSRLVPGTSLGSSPDCFPDWFQEPVWEAVWRLLPRLLPRHLFQEVSGKQSGQLQDAGFPGSWETTRNLENHRFPRILGNRGFGGSRGPDGTAGTSIPYSIYISQFQTGTPKPRYIGFRAGGRENGTQNGQFRPVFGHYLRPLPKPHFFSLFTL
jgi:hypothetical protein